MKRTILRYAALLTLLWASPAPGSVSGAPVSAPPAWQELTADSLQRLCGGELPLYASGQELWLEIPDGELRLTVQVNRGAGMRNRPLRSLTTFRLTADREAGLTRVQSADTLTIAASATTPLPLARVAGTERMLAGIRQAVLAPGLWYEGSGGILRQPRPGHERLLKVDTTVGGTLLTLEAWYDVESPERGTEIQMSAGALPLEISLLLEKNRPTELTREVVMASDLPAEYAEAVRRAVGRYNRSHRRAPLTLVSGGEVLPLTTPFGISFDGADERLTTVVRRNPQSGEAAFMRLGLGTASWEREALRRALRTDIPYGRMRQLLTDAGARRRDCLDEALADALTGIFDPRAKETAASSSRKDLGKEFRTARRQIERWERFMQREGISDAADNMAVPETVLYEEMLTRTQQLCLRLAEQSRGTALQREIIEWIADGLIADCEGRFATPSIRRNGQTISRREAARRMDKIWNGVLSVASPRSLAGIGRLFHSALEKSGSDAFAMQASFVGALLRILAERPELAATAEELETLYTRMAGATDPETALFARLEGQRLAARTK